MKNARALLFYSVVGVFIATAILTLLGISGVVAIEERFLQVLFTILVVELVAAVIGLFKATDWFGGERGSKPFEGGWWQLVRADADANVMAFLHLDYSEERQQLLLEGRAFTAEGESHSRFWSVSASLNASTGELHYFWTGDHEESDEDFSGVGYIRFASPDSAVGWFTAGNLDDLRVTARRKVEYWRASDAESTTMRSKDDPEERRRLAASAYAKAGRTERVLPLIQ